MNFLKRVFGVLRISRQVSRLDSKVSALMKEKENSDYEIEHHLNRLKEVERSLRDEIAKTLVALSDSKKLNSKLEEGLSAVRDELKTATEITIPGLVAANDVFIKRWEAESKIHVMRTALSEPRSETSQF